MTQADKELLLKDLCVRLPYNVRIEYNGTTFTNIFDVLGIAHGRIVLCLPFMSKTEYPLIEEVKPYLFPLSSITEDMMEELNANGFFKYRDSITNVSHLESKNGISEEIYTYIDIESISFLTEYFHSHHIDYRGLIPKGLAIDATGLNIY